VLLNIFHLPLEHPIFLRPRNTPILPEEYTSLAELFENEKEGDEEKADAGDWKAGLSPRDSLESQIPNTKPL
tara:strand:- start:411 stop:626 length:216 start_codon:yes stop_codon:yes gene_type:complete